MLSTREAPAIVVGIKLHRYVSTTATCSAKLQVTMNPKQLFVALIATSFILGSGLATAGETINEAGAIACVNDTSKVSQSDRGPSVSA